MRKLSLLIFQKEYQSSLEELREMGVVHVHENKKKNAENDDLRQKNALLKIIAELQRRLLKLREESDLTTVDNDLMAKWQQLSSEEEKCSFFRTELGLSDSSISTFNLLEDGFKEVESLSQQIANLEKDRGTYGPWGAFSQSRVSALADAGWEMRFFSVPTKKYKKEWEEKYSSFVINEVSGQCYFVTVQNKNDEALKELDSFILPELSAEQLDAEIIRLENNRVTLLENYTKIADFALEYLSDLILNINDEIDMIKVDLTKLSFVDDKVLALEAWLPTEKENEVVSRLDAMGVVYEISEPDANDNPPIKLKNSRFARLFESIGELYDMPSYRELDLTPFFAPFFVLFFGFCLGDCGYGLLILLGVTFYKFKASDDMKPILTLAQWLGSATIIMGIVSGTMFGIPLLEAEWAVSLKDYMLDSSQLFNLSLALGAVQIIFGMIVKVANLWKQSGFASAISTIGWLVLILGVGGCTYLETTGMNVTFIRYGVLGVAGVMILLLNDIKRNPLINVGFGILDVYGMATGLLGDILSYIRLFALGVSSSVLGLVFNNIAVNMSPDIPGVKILVMVIILLIGHGINLFLACLGSFVHPMRLTFVEFYKNAGFNGGGSKYKPLKKRIINE